MQKGEFPLSWPNLLHTIRVTDQVPGISQTHHSHEPCGAMQCRRKPSCFCALGRRAAEAGQASRQGKPSTKFPVSYLRQPIQPRIRYLLNFLFVTRKCFLSQILHHVSVCDVDIIPKHTTCLDMSLASGNVNGAVNQGVFLLLPKS